MPENSPQFYHINNPKLCLYCPYNCELITQQPDSPFLLVKAQKDLLFVVVTDQHR